MLMAGRVDFAPGHSRQSDHFLRPRLDSSSEITFANSTVPAIVAADNTFQAQSGMTPSFLSALIEPRPRLYEIRIGGVQHRPHVAPIRALLLGHEFHQHLASDQRISQRQQSAFNTRLKKLRRIACLGARCAFQFRHDDSPITSRTGSW